MKAKKNKLVTLKALLNGEITVDQVVKKIKLVFTSDPLDQPLIDAADYLKANATARTAPKKKKPKKNQAVPAPPLESPINAPQRISEPRPQESTMIFSTEADRYEQYRQQIQTSINSLLR